jgi:hypothetical protein
MIVVSLFRSRMGFLKRWIFGQSVPKNSKKEQQQTKKHPSPDECFKN